MQNNSLGKIAVANTKRPRSRFDMSGDLHTSMDFGSVIPARMQLMIPNSKVVASSHERILCSPMLAPTMGRLGLKVYHNFVRLSDLTENFAPMLSQEAVSRNASQFVPQQVPSMRLKELSLFALMGAYLNIYENATTGAVDDSGDISVVTSGVYSGTTGILASDAMLSTFGLLTKVSSSPTLSILGLSSGFGLYASFLLHETFVNRYYIVLGNPQNATFYPIDPTCDYYKTDSQWFDLSDVTPENADVVIPVEENGKSYYFCFRLSDYGKRIRKILLGCGYQLDFTSDAVVSLLPLFAFYKSYFDVFGLTLYQNWEQTYAYRFLRLADLIPSPYISAYWTQSTSPADLREFFRSFMLAELANSYYTDEQDFVSAHTRNTAVSPNAQPLLNSIVTDVDANASHVPNIGAGQTSPNEPPDLTTPNGHAMITDILHGQLDSELLKILYRWTNRNTIAGRRIAELLRAQGLGSYVDECKSDFIGSFDVPINVYDGISSSDTFNPNTDSGAPLGERFGNGQSETEPNTPAERPFEFECNEFGYWVTLMVVVPKGGYADALDPTAKAVTKFQFYTPDFDSKGMEFNAKDSVVANMPFADFTAASGKLTDSFGLAPRYFAWKFGRNLVNGDFSRRSVRDAFAPYYLDRMILVGDRRVHQENISLTTVRTFSIVKSFKPINLPIAGNAWRYPTRYPFTGNYNRIFNMVGSQLGSLASMDPSRQSEFEVFNQTDDNILVHMIFNIQYFAPMLPVADSFETADDEVRANSSVGKA